MRLFNKFRSKSGSRSGFTLMEITLAGSLLMIVAVKAHGALNSATNGIDKETQRAFIEEQARRVLRQVGFAIMGSNRDSLLPGTEGNISSGELSYRVNLGISDGDVVWSDMNKVAMDNDDLKVFHAINPNQDDESRVYWTNLVAPFLEGEIPNGMDDNGNGLIDETGLSFVIDGNSVTIRMTLQRILDDGTTLTETVSTVVTCRNLGA